MIRAVAAALIWFQMFIALVLLAPGASTPPSPYIPMLLALTIGEVFYCYRVLVIDAKRT